jgi:hypothetical protein
MVPKVGLVANIEILLFQSNPPPNILITKVFLEEMTKWAKAF